MLLMGCFRVTEAGTGQCSGELGCPSIALCVHHQEGGHICACKPYYQNSDGSYPSGCTVGFHDRSLTIFNDLGEAAPDPRARLPDDAFTAVGGLTNSKPHYARLNTGIGEESAWCGDVSLEDYWIDSMLCSGGKICMYREAVMNKDVRNVFLGAPTLVTMVATQGQNREFFTNYVITFQMMYKRNNQNWVAVPSPDSPQVFTANTDELTPVYNILVEPLVNTTHIRIIPIDYSGEPCIRMEVYGDGDINECENGWSNCDSRAQCINTPSSFRCICPPGADDVIGDGSFCPPLDECATGRNNCSRQGICTDLPVGFNCTCPDGFLGDGYYCEDIDECVENLEDCHAQAACVNQPGSFICTCIEGYEGTGTNCTDINECDALFGSCDFSATCTNLPGSFSCRCNPGFEGDGKICYDIDECKLNRDNCDLHANCINIFGAFVCQCKSGFQGNGVECKDINECEKELDDCSVSERCFNTLGSYKCQCPNIVPLQEHYTSAETRITLEMIYEITKVREKEFEYPVNYFVHVLRLSYMLMKRLYQYRFSEVKSSFQLIQTTQDNIIFELYDFRCGEVGNFKFPNFCHHEYADSIWPSLSDRVDIKLPRSGEEPFEEWGDFLVFYNGGAPNADGDSSENQTIISAVYTDYLQVPCYHVLTGESGNFSSPLFPEYYPINAKCWFEIRAPPNHDIYIKFTNFSLEYDRKCIYDYVSFHDSPSKTSPELKRYCGDEIPPPVRSNGSVFWMFFHTDFGDVRTGFNAIWGTLKPRISITCLTYNPFNFNKDPELAARHMIRMLQLDRSVYVLTTRLLACHQYPTCDRQVAQPPIYSFEHVQEDRPYRQCVFWPMESMSASWSDVACIIEYSNKTHTICKCNGLGIVGVLGRKEIFYAGRQTIEKFELGSNCLLSLVIAIFTLIATLIYLLFRDGWLFLMIRCYRDSEFDHGQVTETHIIINTLLATIFFTITTFSTEASEGSCFLMALACYYLVQTIFTWIFLYSVYLFSYKDQLFDVKLHNVYKIFLTCGYGIPLLVTLTIAGLKFKFQQGQRLCWILFHGTSVWGYGGSILALSAGSIALQLFTLRNASGTRIGEKCGKAMLTTLAALFTCVTAAKSIEDGDYGPQYLFSFCNVLQAYTIVVGHCILSAEVNNAKKIHPDEKPPLSEREEENNAQGIPAAILEALAKPKLSIADNADNMKSENVKMLTRKASILPSKEITEEEIDQEIYYKQD